MKKLLLLFCILLAGKCIAQSTLVNRAGAKIVVLSGTHIKVNDIRNEGTNSQISNNGSIYPKGNFSQNTGATYSGTATSLLSFEGTTLQNINADVTTNIARLRINNANGVQLNQNINVSTELNVLLGDLNLNGRNVDLGTTGILSEDRANNHIVKDNTAINDANQGGAIIVSGVNVTNASTEIRGTGLYLQRTTGTNYTVSFTRKHYRGSGNGIKRIYGVTGTPTGTNSIMRIYYASDELAGVSGMLRLFRWTAGIGWKQAIDAGSGYTNGTNGAGYAEATGINAFSTWTIGSETAPLPLTLLSFSGKRQDENNVLLHWKTANEVNNKGFDVEMAENGVDFNKIAFVDKNANQLGITNYELGIKQPNSAYFRLKQLDENGSFSYSNIVFIENFEKEINVFPNPTSDFVTIDNIPQNTKIMVNDIFGKSMLETFSQKETSLKINLKDWAKGTYLVKIGKVTKKIVVE